MSRVGVYHLFTKKEKSSITLQGKKQRVVSPYREKNSEWYHLTGKNSEWYHLIGKKTASGITLQGKTASGITLQGKNSEWYHLTG